MEKSVAVGTTKENVSNSSPSDEYDDVHLSILSKLSLKSLKRFECVCKSWSLLIENSYFMAMFSNKFISSYYADEYLILYPSTPTESPLPFYCLLGEEKGYEKLIRFDRPDPLPENFLDFHSLYSNSTNGILCLCQHLGQTVLWNPATKEVKLIPPNPFLAPPDVTTTHRVHGFGYDRVTNDCKLIRYVYFRRHFCSEDILPPPFWEIYNVTSNSCRKLDNINMPTSLRSRSHAYMNGVCHWLFFENNYQNGRLQSEITLLASFDLSNEVIFNTPLPPEVDAIFRDEQKSVLRSRRQCLLDRRLHLVALNGSITLVYCHTPTATFTMSILGELGGKESWTKLLVVGPLPFVEYPIGLAKELEMFLRTKNKQLARFDIHRQIINELGLKVEKIGSKIVRYKENFLSILKE